jgi:hypothetical protein
METIDSSLSWEIPYSPKHPRNSLISEIYQVHQEKGMNRKHYFLQVKNKPEPSTKRKHGYVTP